MDGVALVMGLGVLEYFWFAVQTGRARVRHNIQAPATTGHPEFERYFRIQYNTLEQLAIFIPALFLFASYISPPWAAAIGAFFLIGRLIYYRNYLKNPDSRAPGVIMTFLANGVLLLGGLGGALYSLLR